MSEKQVIKKMTRPGLSMVVGLIFGGFLGLIGGDLIVFAGGGMILGLCIGLSTDHSSMRINL